MKISKVNEIVSIMFTSYRVSELTLDGGVYYFNIHYIMNSVCPVRVYPHFKIESIDFISSTARVSITESSAIELNEEVLRVVNKVSSEPA